MASDDMTRSLRVARYAGWALLATFLIGVLTALFVVQGIDINLSGDVTRTAHNMLDAEIRLRAKAYLGALILCLEAVVSIGFFILLRRSGELLAGSCLFVSLVGSVLSLLGALYAMNVSEMASGSAYASMAADTRLMLASVQVTSNHTSFHLGLALSTLANAGFYILFLKSRLIPKIIAGWGLFASIFVVTIIVARDFIPALGDGTITAAFMGSNVIALISTGLYLGIWGVRSDQN